MTRRQESLEAVRRITTEREKEAGRELAELRRRLKEAEARMAELLEYRRQYQERFHLAGRRGMGVGQLNEYRIFLSRLDQALAQQRQTVARCRTAFERGQARWLECRRECKAVDKLADRRRQEARRRAGSREQKELDEFASRRHKGVLA